MAVQSSPSQKPLEDALRMGQSMNTSILSMSTPNFLKNISIFSLPFTGISIIAINTRSGTWHIELPFFMVTFLVVFNVRSIARSLVLNYGFEKNSVHCIVFFLLTCLLSNLQHFSCEKNNLSDLASLFSCLTFLGPKYIFVNLFYVTIGFLFSIYISSELKSLDDLQAVTRWFLAGAILLASIGIFEFAFHSAGLSFPYRITNNTSCYSLSCASVFPRMHSELGVMRISAGSAEPSIYSQPVLFALIYLISFATFNMTVFEKHIDRIVIVVLLFSFTHAWSTSAYLAGSAALIFHTKFKSRLNISDHTNNNFLRLLVISMGIYAVFNINLIVGFLNNLVINKIFTDSGVERLNSVRGALEVFTDGNFIYGQSFGMVNSFDFFVKVLSNTGVLGLTLMLGLILILLQGLWRKIYFDKDKAVVVVSYSVFVIFVSAILLYQLSGWAYQHMYTFFPFGLAMALVRRERVDASKFQTPE